MAVSDTTTATGSPPTRDPDDIGVRPRSAAGPVRTLGLLRWVQIAFMAAGMGLFWFLDKFGTALWGVWGEPDSTLSTVVSALVAVVAVSVAYKHESTNRAAHEVIGELVKVTWPSRKETSSSTVVVIITSIIAAMLLGVMDAIWSTITDFIY